MTDLEKLKALLREWEVPFGEVHEEAWCEDPEMLAVYVGEGDSPKISGYGGFYTRFEFDLEGKFIKIGAWE